MSQRRRSRREGILFRLPSSFLQHPFEVMIALYATITGAALLAGLSYPKSLVFLLPGLSVKVWAVGLLVGAGALVTGIVLKPPSAPFMAAGLRLLGILCVVYAVALFDAAGFRHAFQIAAFNLAIAALAGFRAFALRTVDDVGERISKES